MVVYPPTDFIQTGSILLQTNTTFEIEEFIFHSNASFIRYNYLLYNLMKKTHH